jgi:hypothetical protein
MPSEVGGWSPIVPRKIEKRNRKNTRNQNGGILPHLEATTPWDTGKLKKPKKNKILVQNQ